MNCGGELGREQSLDPLTEGFVRTYLGLQLPHEEFDSGLRNVTEHLSTLLGVSHQCDLQGCVAIKTA